MKTERYLKSLITEPAEVVVTGIGSVALNFEVGGTVSIDLNLVLTTLDTQRMMDLGISPDNMEVVLRRRK